MKAPTNMLVIPVIEKPALTVASANAAMRVATVMPLRGVCAAGTVTGADGTSVTVDGVTVGSGVTLGVTDWRFCFLRNLRCLSALALGRSTRWAGRRGVTLVSSTSACDMAHSMLWVRPGAVVPTSRRAARLICR